MEPKSFGRKLGIGVRVASRVFKQSVDAHARQAALESAQAAQTAKAQVTAAQTPIPNEPKSRVQEASSKTARIVRETAAQTARTARQQAPKVAAQARGFGVGARRFGRAMWGPFAHVSSVLWSEVTGVFFGLFAFYFGQEIFKYRADYAAGPNHQKFVLDVALTLIFGYFTLSSFYIARRKEKRRR